MKPIRTLSDAELIQLSPRDPAAFEELFDRHAVPLRDWLVSRTHDRALAQDLLGETFAQALRGARRFRGEQEGAGGAWLFGIARNLLRQHYRRGRVETAARRRLGIATGAGDEGGIQEMLDRVDSEPLAGRVRLELAKLPAEQRRAIDRRIVDERTYEEIAEELAIEPVTARSRVSRGLQALRAGIQSASSGVRP